MKTDRSTHRQNLFDRLCTGIAHTAGHPVMFSIAFLSIILWCLLGPVYHYSDTWQLVVNTATTVVTFLMVFLI